MPTAILIDDEPNALEMLEWQLQKYCPAVKIIALCQSADKAIEAIKEQQPDLIFLDIEMPVKNGFEVLKAFDDPGFKVIFTTAYDQFAIKAFKFAAFDYLLKPIDTDDLTATVNRYLNTVQKESVKEQLQVLLSQYKQSTTPDRIALNTQEGLLMVKPESIIRCQSLSNYTKIFLEKNRQLVISKTLKEVEETLGPQQFFRIHQSHLINLNHIQSYKRQDGGFVKMSDGEELAIARNRKDDFMARFSRI